MPCPHGRNTKIILASILDLRAVLTMISQILHVLSNAYIFSHIHFVGEIHAVSYNGICIAILHHPGGAFDIWITQKYHIMFCWHVLKIRHKTFLCIYSCKDNNLFFYLRLTSSALRTNVIYSSMPISRRGNGKNMTFYVHTHAHNFGKTSLCSFTQSKPFSPLDFNRLPVDC